VTPVGRDATDRRRRSFLLASGLLILIAVLTGVETYIQGQPAAESLTIDFVIFLIGNLNYLLMTILIFVVLRYLVKLGLERRRGVLGSKFQTKLVAAFIAVSIMPAMILYFAASRFISRSINLLFSPEITTLSEASEGVAQTFYRNNRDQALFFAGRVAERLAAERLLSGTAREAVREAVVKGQQEYNLGAVQVFSASGEELARAINPAVPRDLFVGPAASVVERALRGESPTTIDEYPEGEFIRGVAPVLSALRADEIIGVVAVSTFVPHSLQKRIDVITDVSRNYYQLKARRDPIAASYTNLLLSITLTVIFSAIWLGTSLAKGITIPIQKLAEATNAVADGDLDFKVNAVANDEIGILIDSFNRMTDDLKTNKLELEEANLTLQRAILELDRKGRYLETLLESIDAGVISVDPDGVVTTYNRSAKRMLGLPTEAVLGRSFRQVFRDPSLSPVLGILERASEAGEETEREIRLELPTGTLLLMTYCTPLQDDRGGTLGIVAVLDDLTELVTAQKMAAWKEVAQRIAHEIKNPLTPVKLSAERLLRKFLPPEGEQAAVFRECVDTIIRQVDDIKGLVDAFSRFAKMPEPRPEETDLNSLVREVAASYQDRPGGIKLVTELTAPLPQLYLDREQLRRALVNLVENAAESMPHGGAVTVSTARRMKDDVVMLEVADEGTGVRREDRDRIFLPYVSMKASGTGLGLAIVHQIVTDNRGTITVRDNHPKGSVFSIALPARGISRQTPPPSRGSAA
jgi:two-component system nitrogen regulation sensor histidine kinase NtrY